MAFSMSGVEDGYSYNRFDLYEKKGKDCDCDDKKKKPKGGYFGAEKDEEDGDADGGAMSEGLDPVGKEDGDVDNDGDKDSSDSYLMKRRKAIAKAMKKEETELEIFTEKELDVLEEMLGKHDSLVEADMKDAPSIKDAKPAKKTDVKMYKGLGIAPVINKEEYKDPIAHALEADKKMGDLHKKVDNDVKRMKAGKKFKEETELQELNRYEKETGESSGSLNMPKGRPTQKGGSSDPAMRATRKMMRDMTGTPPGQKKKIKGMKPKPGITPVDKIKNKLAQQRAPKPNPYKARPGESD